jgi:Zn-dependent protease with chaperone function
MRLPSLRRILPLIVVVLGVLCSAHATAAMRPDVLDRRVDALSRAQLLHDPPTALVDPARQRAALWLMERRTAVWIAIALGELLVFFLWWQRGWAASWRDVLRRRLRNEHAVRWAFGATLGLIARIVAAIPQLYLFRLFRGAGLTSLPMHVWGLYWLEWTLIVAVGVGCVVAIVLALVDRTHLWYAITAVSVMGLTIGAAWIHPLLVPLIGGAGMRAPTAVMGEERQIAVRLGMASVPPIVVVPAMIAGGRPAIRVIGLWATQRIVVDRAILAAATPGEIRFELARVLWEIAHGIPLPRAIVLGALLILAIAGAVVLAERVPFRRDDDALARLALVAAGCAAFALPAIGVDRAYERATALAADRAAVAITGDPASAVRAIVRSADHDLIPICGAPVGRFLFARRPVPAERIAAVTGRPISCR